MRTVRGLALALVILMLAAQIASAESNVQRHFQAFISGREEVPPRESSGQGFTTFELNDAETALEFKLIVANIRNVIAAHIHCGAPGVNGPIVVFLFGPGLAAFPNGVLSEGTITEADIIPVPDSPACPGGVANFAELLEKMRTGNAYVNVHTVEFPGGEIRGQIRTVP